MGYRSISRVILPAARIGATLLLGSQAVRSDNAPLTGEAVYQRRCAACHDQVSPRIPPRAALQRMSAARILRTLDFGLMMSIAYPLHRDEREAVAKFLGTPGDDAPLTAAAFCSNKEFPLSTTSSASWTGWSPTSSNTRFQSTENAGITAAQVPKLKLKWAFGFSGDIISFAAPTVRDGTLFVGSASGIIYAMNAKSGCLYWTFQANGPVRSAPLIAESGDTVPLLFGDQIGWFYALDAATGRLRWKQRIDDHEATRLTGSPAFHNGVVFVPAASWEESRAVSPDYPCCTFRGSITALRVADGSQVWKTYLVDSPKKLGVTPNGTPIYGPSGAGVWSAPTVDRKRNVLYVTTGDNYSVPASPTSDAVVALQLDSGKIVWLQQTTQGDAFNGSCGDKGSSCGEKKGPDYDYGSSALLVTVGVKELVLAGQKSGIVYALDPDQKGKILWQAHVGEGGVNGGIEWGMASDEHNVYAATAHPVRLNANALGPVVVGNGIFDPVKGGGLTALRLQDGAKVWFAPSHPCTPPRPGCSPAQSAALSAIPGVVLTGALDGHLRALSTTDGNVLWDFDTVRDYSTVDGIPGKGGSLDGPGPVIVDGLVYVNSGYPRFGGTPGNVLLAFSVDGK